MIVVGEEVEELARKSNLISICDAAQHAVNLANRSLGNLKLDVKL